MAGKEKKRAGTIVEINLDWCKGCGICVAFCPKQVLEKDDRDKARWARPEECNVCGICELRCPDMAIEMREPSPAPST